MTSYNDLLKHLDDLQKLGYVLELLGWDEQINLPPKGQAARGEASAHMASLYHKHFTDPQFMKLVDELAKSSSKLEASQQAVVREVKRDLDKARKLPAAHVEALAKLTSQAFPAWAEAKAKADFSIFQPYLEKIVKLKQAEAEYYGFADHAYSALVDDYEPGMTVTELDPLLEDLKAFTIEFVRKNQTKKAPKTMGTVAEAAQEQAVRRVVADMGYDFEAGILSQSLHPFTMGLHPTDVRITTAYKPESPLFSLESSIHEAGHGLYEQGLPAHHHSTPLGQSVSLGLHESQSRIWENMVGKSQAFCTYLFPLLQEYFGKELQLESPTELYDLLNEIKPNLIRIQSDEVTYNLHIILRYELEKALVEGSLQVADLPAAWNAKVKEYLGIVVPDDGVGVLQDVHWSGGSIGYFPTYTLGNIYAAQLFAAARRDIAKLDTQFAAGDFKPFLAWLRTHVHQHGRFYSAEELVTNATGEAPTVKYLTDYFKEKFSQ